MVIDNLHLFLRVSDVLLNLLITELRRQDAIDKTKRFSSFEISKYKHIQGFQQFVKSLGIPGFEFYIGQTSKELKCRSLLVLKNCVYFRIYTFDYCYLISLVMKPVKSNTCGMNCYSSTCFCKPGKELSSDTIEDFEHRTRQWGRDFIRVYQTKNVTPYIHALMNHVGQFMRIHGCILAFTQQGLEKLNDIMTKNFSGHHAIVKKPLSNSLKNKTESNI